MNLIAGKWYAFVIDGDYTNAQLFEYLGDGVWADENEALDSVPDYDELVLQP